MTYFKINRFFGTAPAVSSRLLNEQFGQIAENLDLESGRLVAIKEDVDVLTLQNSLRRSIYLYRDTNWLEWDDEDVSAVSGPIAGDTTERLYFTGEDYPRMGNVAKMISGSSGYPAASFALGIPYPSAAPTVTKSGTADADSTPNDVSYVYTFVSDFGEESAPSAPSTVFELSNGESAAITMAANSQPSGNYALNANTAYKRLYRSNTGSTNTTFQLVTHLTPATGSAITTGNIPYTQTAVTDAMDAASLGEVLPSDGWIPPPTAVTTADQSLYPDGPLQGLIPLAQGVMAGFTGKRFCLSEPFLPHAWPINYRITTEEDIVAIASTANGIAALTDGHPYFITGVDPSAMTAVRIDLAQACVNKRSVVDMGDYVLYAGPDGLCAVQSSEGSIVTKGLISVAQWTTDYNPTTIRAFRHENTYVAFHAGGGWVFDPRGNENSLLTITVATDIRDGYMNPKDGELYIIVADKIKKYRGSGTNKTLKFKSKKFVTNNPVSMSWVSIAANTYPVTIKVWGDGTLVAHYVITKSGTTYTQATTAPSNISNITMSQPNFRLPATIAQEWEVQVEGTDVHEFCLAQSMEEIRSA
tara:strand:+ start:787 stop:2544 length:1758 start_codon:yes stop_codon:yes gene_type:complete